MIPHHQINEIIWLIKIIETNIANCYVQHIKRLTDKLIIY